MHRQQKALRSLSKRAAPPETIPEEVVEEVVEEFSAADDDGACETQLKQPTLASKVVASFSGLKMERMHRARLLKSHPLKAAMPKELEWYRMERQKLKLSNLLASSHSPDAHPANDTGVEPQCDHQDKVEHFLCDKLLFIKYCTLDGELVLPSGYRQKSMDLAKFLFMLDEVGALKSGSLVRGDKDRESRKEQEAIREMERQQEELREQERERQRQKEEEKEKEKESERRRDEEKERERKRERNTERDLARVRDSVMTMREKEKERERERARQKEEQSEKLRQREREKERQIEKRKQSERDREREQERERHQERRREKRGFKAKGTEHERDAGGEGRIPKMEGLERKLLNKHQATNCFRAAMAQTKTQQLIAAGELNFDLYKIAAKLVAEMYVHGVPEGVEDTAGDRMCGRMSCPPLISLLPAGHSNANAEIYAKILEALPRRRPHGESALLDEVEKLLLDPKIFEKFCSIQEQYWLENSSRSGRTTMSQNEWFMCLAELGLMPPEVLREVSSEVLRVVVEPCRFRKKTKPVYPDVVSKLERRLTKEQASTIFRRALGKSGSKYGEPSGTLSFRPYCVAAQLAAKFLVHGDDAMQTDTNDKSENRKRFIDIRVKKPEVLKNNHIPQWNDRFSIRGGTAKKKEKADKTRAKVHFNISSDVAGASTEGRAERVLSEKSMELAEKGDRAMLCEEFCLRFATRDAFIQHVQRKYTNGTDASAITAKKVLHGAVVDCLEVARLVPDFLSKENVFEMLSKLSDVQASVKSQGKSVSFGGTSPIEAASPLLSKDDCNINEEVDQPETCAPPANDKFDSGANSRTWWSFSDFRNCFEQIATHIDLQTLQSFLQSPHACIYVPIVTTRTNNRRMLYGKQQVPATPWTQEHPTAAYRPRTSLRILMLYQKDLRRAHIANQQKKRERSLKQLEQFAREMELIEKEQEMKAAKRQQWRDALNAIDAKMREMRQNEELLLEKNELHKMTMEEAIEMYGTAEYLEIGHIPAYTKLPVLDKSRSLSQQLGFVNLALHHPQYKKVKTSGHSLSILSNKNTHRENAVDETPKNVVDETIGEVRD